MTKPVGIYVFDEVEVLDFAGPFEVFSTASRVKARLVPESPAPFEVFTVAATAGTVRARGNLGIVPHFNLKNHPPLDILIVPGGVVTSELQRDHVIGWIKQASQSALITASVCTGAFLLAQAGLLNDKQATTHWEDLDNLQAMFPKLAVVRDVRWVDSGTIVTAAGISAGIDMSLHLVARVESEELARQTAHQMEFAWTPTSG
jgi:transcriptional regulator GlxA family with amidase domain